MPDPTTRQIETVIAAKDRAEKESDYAESVECTATLISGDRYKVTFSGHSDYEGGY